MSTPRPTPPLAAPNPASTSQAATAVVTNGIRLTAVAEKLASHFHGSLVLTTTELFQLCYALARSRVSWLETEKDRLAFILDRSIYDNISEIIDLCHTIARGIDYALSSNDIPRVANSIPVLVKKAFQHRNEPALHSALMVLVISAKNACGNGWFQAEDRDEILAMEKELSSSFCLSVGLNPDASDALATINEITPRFYPQIKWTKLLASFEAKPGYDILMSDFFIQRNIPANEKIRLYVIQRGNLETSSCIAQPPLVSFLVNGKGVERRNNVSMETGPQVPTDITKMLKYGTNIVQAAGYFSSNYIIAIAFTSKLDMVSPPIFEDYIEPSAEIESDSEIIEGRSTVSLNCPISFGRIKTPVKGYQCRHPQCFDYENYMEMNWRKPAWRCPHCNRPVCALDIRLDQKMVNILKATDANASHITMLSDGSWKKVEEHDNNHPANRPIGDKKDENNDAMGDAAHDVIDLTMEENDGNELMEVEDTKPSLDCQEMSLPQSNTLLPLQPQTSHVHAAEDNAWLRNTFSPAYGTLESLLPDGLRNPSSTSSSSHLQPHLQPGSSASRMPSMARSTMRVPGTMQTPPTPIENPSRRIGNGMLNTMNYANRSGAGLQLPSASSVTVAVNGDFGSALGSVPSSFVASQNLSQNQASANRPCQQMMGVSAQRPSAPTSSTHRLTNSFRIPSSSSVLSSMNPTADNISIAVPPHQQSRFPPVRVPTSMHGSIRTHTQPSSLAPLQENASGLVHQTSSASVLPEMPPEQGWRPTGRMRGSLTGEAYSAALNHYLVQPNSPNPSTGANPNPNPNLNTNLGGSNAQSTLGQMGRRW